MSISDQIKNLQDGMLCDCYCIDIKELEGLVGSAVRPTVKLILQTQITTMRAQITDVYFIP